MFDYGAPKEFPVNKGKPLGVGKHPHRGFETVTIAFQGEAEHHDSTGGHGIIKEGDIQWMTAGRGIVHEEYHSREFSNRGDARNVPIVGKLAETIQNGSSRDIKPLPRKACRKYPWYHLVAILVRPLV
jgi:hypothetical protein